MVVHWERTHDLFGSETAVICIWFRGIITNRAQLLKRCHLPPECNNSELIAALYQQEGVVAAELIFGSCAWIVWDGQRKQLIATRDRVGLCHLYYVQQGTTVAVAERVEALLPFLSSIEINISSAVRYLNTLTPPPPETYYLAVHSVEPGGFVRISINHLEAGRYWRLQPQPLLRLTSDEEYAEVFRYLVAEVVASYVSSVPMGITLSSGMDSTTIAATIKATHPSADLTAFSWIAPELPEADESGYVEAVWQQLTLPGIPIRSDQHWPLSDPGGVQTSRSSPYYNYYTELWDATFATMGQHGIQVAFLGTSHDYQFGGHEYAYLELLLTGHWLELMRQFRKIRTISMYNFRQLLWRMFFRPAFWVMFPRRETVNKIPVPWLSSSSRELYYSSMAPPVVTFSFHPARQQILESIVRLSIAEVIEPVGWQADRYGIEVRHPLMDHRLLEFALRLPLTQTVRAGQHKIIMRHAMRGYLPDTILNLRNKILPTAIALRGLKEREQGKVLTLMTNMRTAELGLVDEKKLQAAYHTYRQSNQTSSRFWYAITLEDWLRRYF